MVSINLGGVRLIGSDNTVLFFALVLKQLLPRFHQTFFITRILRTSMNFKAMVVVVMVVVQQALFQRRPNKGSLTVGFANGDSGKVVKHICQECCAFFEPILAHQLSTF